MVPCVIVGALATLVVAAEVVDSAKGCGSVDPTDPANYSRVMIINDGSAPVVLDDCMGADCTIGQPVRIAPGQRYTGDAACGASGAEMTSWRVNTDNGALLGYIAVDSPRKNDHLVSVSPRRAPAAELRPVLADLGATPGQALQK